MVPEGIVVVDATFLIDLIRSQPDAQKFVAVLGRSVATTVNFGEALYKLGQSSTAKPAAIERALTSTGLTIADVDLRVARRFLELKDIDKKSTAVQGRAGMGPAKTLSLGDLACLGYALDHGFPALTADRHWTTLAKHGLTVPVFDYRDPNTRL
ncbi:MAG TPA: PIN domain-containing protein [Acidimicrobiales bacterium]|nr:PIN domain-containing protein [Acidimicrobiales bacterium]